jgi:O-antigen/teichoic acid export membrane protein
VFVTCGFGTALIQKKDADKLDFSSILIINVIVGIGIYVLIYFLAPLISGFYNMDLTNVFRVLALKIPLASINSVQQAYADDLIR